MLYVTVQVANKVTEEEFQTQRIVLPPICLFCREDKANQI